MNPSAVVTDVLDAVLPVARLGTSPGQIDAAIGLCLARSLRAGSGESALESPALAGSDVRRRAPCNLDLGAAGAGDSHSITSGGLRRRRRPSCRRSMPSGRWISRASSPIRCGCQPWGNVLCEQATRRPMPPREKAGRSRLRIWCCLGQQSFWASGASASRCW